MSIRSVCDVASDCFPSFTFLCNTPHPVFELASWFSLDWCLPKVFLTLLMFSLLTLPFGIGSCSKPNTNVKTCITSFKQKYYPLLCIPIDFFTLVLRDLWFSCVVVTCIYLCFHRGWQSFWGQGRMLFIALKLLKNLPGDRSRGATGGRLRFFSQDSGTLMQSWIRISWIILLKCFKLSYSLWSFTHYFTLPIQTYWIVVLGKGPTNMYF